MNDETTLMLAALSLGALIGVSIAVMFATVIRRGEKVADLASNDAPAGVVQVFQALQGVGIVVDASNTPLSASATAIHAGWVQDGRVAIKKAVKLIDQVRHSGEPHTDTISYVATSGLSAVWHASAAPLGSRFILLIAEDRTESERLNQLRKDFLANVSHELKTPIASLMLLSEALSQSTDNPKQAKKFTARMLEESTRLSELAGDIIELSRVESAETAIDSKVVRLDRVVKQAIEGVRVIAAEQEVELHTALEEKISTLGTEKLLVSAVENIIKNAVNISEKKNRVAITLKKSGDWAEIIVTDNGPGIPEEELERIFERFYRVDSGRGRSSGGTGLGLSIVKHVVTRHGGTVKAWSKVGKGATFTIRLPLATTV